MHGYLSAAQAMQYVPGKASHTTVWRWCTKGIYVRQAKRTVQLQHVFVGRRLYTRAEWLEQFYHELMAARYDLKPKVKLAGWQRRRMDLAEADAILARARI